MVDAALRELRARIPVSIRQLIKYGFAGGSAVVLHFAVLTGLVEILAVNPTMATAAGFVAGCVLNYALQHRWVFRADGRHITFARRYALVTAATFVLNVALFHALHAVVGLWYVLAQVIATVVVFLVNFEINRRYTFAR